MLLPQKEQADGDYQNLVCILKHAYRLTLQEAVDMLTRMIQDRVQEYVDLKRRLPSFGPKVDAALMKYHTALEHFVQGCIVWYYSSPREYWLFSIALPRLIDVLFRLFQGCQAAGEERGGH